MATLATRGMLTGACRANFPELFARVRGSDCEFLCFHKIMNFDRELNILMRLKWVVRWGVALMENADACSFSPEKQGGGGVGEIRPTGIFRPFAFPGVCPK